MKPVTVAGLRLQAGETAYGAYPASLMEARSVSAGYEGGSQGLSIRLAKGVRWRVGAHRGSIRRERASVPVAAGTLVVTDLRLVFCSADAPFACGYDEVNVCEMGEDRLVFGTQARPRVLAVRLPRSMRRWVADRLPFAPAQAASAPRRGRLVKALLLCLIAYMLANVVRGINVARRRSAGRSSAAGSPAPPLP